MGGAVSTKRGDEYLAHDSDDQENNMDKNEHDMLSVLLRMGPTHTDTFMKRLRVGDKSAIDEASNFAASSCLDSGVLLGAHIIAKLANLHTGASLKDYCDRLLTLVDATCINTDVVAIGIFMHKDLITEGHTQSAKCFHAVSLHASSNHSSEVSPDKCDSLCDSVDELLLQWQNSDTEVSNPKNNFVVHPGSFAQLDKNENAQTINAFKLFTMEEGSAANAGTDMSAYLCLSRIRLIENASKESNSEAEPTSKVYNLTADELHSLASMSRSVGSQLRAIALTNLGAIEMVQEHEMLESLLAVNKLLMRREVDVMTSLDFIIAHVSTIIHIDVVIIYLHDEKSNTLWCKSNKGTGLLLSMDEPSVAKEVLQSCDPHIVIDASKDELTNRSFDEAYGIETRNILCLPIISDTNKPLGVIQVVNKEAGQDFTVHDKYMVATVCEELAMVLENNAFEVILAINKTAANPTSHIKPNDNDDKETEPQSKDQQNLVAMLEQYHHTSRAGAAARLITGSGKRGIIGRERSSFAMSMRNVVDGVRRDSSKRDSIKRENSSSGSFNSSSFRRRGRSASVFVSDVNVGKLFDWSFNVFMETDDSLIQCASKLFRKFKVLEHYDMDQTLLLTFLERVCDGYRDNPYHNWKHGFSVLHCVALILNTTAALQLLKFHDVLAVLIGSITHDIGHRGTNNDFEINAESELAVRYNDKSVLENYHAATTFEILCEEDCCLLKSFRSDTRKTIRRLIIKCILATDMAHHVDMVNQIKSKVSKTTFSSIASIALNSNSPTSGPRRSSAEEYSSKTLSPKRLLTTVRQRLTVATSPKAPRLAVAARGLTSFVGDYRGEGGSSSPKQYCMFLNREAEPDRVLLLEMLVHAADLSNPTIEFELCKQWAHLVSTEFYEQSVKEKKLGLPSQAFMEKQPDDIVAKSRLQLNFLDFIVLPLWKLLAQIFPPLDERVNVAMINKGKWQDMLESGGVDLGNYTAISVDSVTEDVEENEEGEEKDENY